jgi:hypothetical protein
MFYFLIYVCNSFKSHDDECTDLFDNSKTFYINVPIGCIMFDFLNYNILLSSDMMNHWPLW